MDTFSLRRVLNGDLVRGWQVLRNEKPISFLFDRQDDAMAALLEFRRKDSSNER